MKTHIHSITFDKHERPKFAVVVTPRGIVDVEWKCVAGDWCWFTSGTGDAKKLVVPAIERIERRFGMRHVSRNDVRCRYAGAKARTAQASVTGVIALMVGNEPMPHLSRQARLSPENGRQIWCSSAMDSDAAAERGKGRNCNSIYA